MRNATWAILCLSLWTLPGHGQVDDQAPTVVETSPANGSENVDPGLDAISVTFSEPMHDRSWSWAYENRDAFPEITADPSYDASFTVNTLPVRLEPHRRYEIWLNTSRYQGFVDRAGNPLHPYRWVFTTGAPR